MTIDPSWEYAEHQRILIAYMNKVGLTKNLTEEQHILKQQEYKEKYTVNEFIAKILEYYDIKGEVTALKLTKAKKKTNEPDEHEIQCEVCKYLDKSGYKYFSVPNGFIFKKSQGDKVAAAKYINYLKAEGLRVGAYDLVILLGNGRVAFLELKSSKGKPSAEQLKFKDYFDSNGYTSAICKGFGEAVAFIDSLKIG